MWVDPTSHYFTTCHGTLWAGGVQYLLADGSRHLQLTHQFYIFFLVLFGDEDIGPVRFQLPSLRHTKFLDLTMRTEMAVIPELRQLAFIIGLTRRISCLRCWRKFEYWTAEKPVVECFSGCKLGLKWWMISSSYPDGKVNQQLTDLLLPRLVIAISTVNQHQTDRHNEFWYTKVSSYTTFNATPFMSLSYFYFIWRNVSDISLPQKMLSYQLLLMCNTGVISRTGRLWLWMFD